MEKKKNLNHKQELSHSRLRKQLLLLLGLLLVLGLGLLLVLWLGLMLGLMLGLGLLLVLWRWLGLGLVLGLGRKLTNRYRQQSKTFTKSETQLPQWIHRFLRDEEKTAILLDYRIRWNRSKHPNKWIRFQVFVKTLRHIFYEVWFEERLYEIKSFQIGILRR